MTLATLKSINFSHTSLKALGRGSWHCIKTASSQKKDLKNQETCTYIYIYDT